MPVTRQLVIELRDILSSPKRVSAEPFRIAADLCRLVSEDPVAPESHELVLRAMELRDNFATASQILDGLVRELGLFPYLDRDTLSLADAIAYEIHRPENMDQNLVFHRAQAHIYHLILSGQNVALSAPTSFGKSLIIDAVIASARFRNIVIVVPTLALIDETRRRLAERFRGMFKIITRPEQVVAERNIFVLTQERVLQIEDWNFVDFFVIDEFYKLAPTSKDDERAALLNHAFYALAKSGAQFYMLGPDIRGITEQNHLRLELRFVHEPHYHTVATHVHRMQLGADEYETLVALIRGLHSPTIIFCRSPSRASEVARRLVAAGIGVENPSLTEAADWISDTYHPEWHFSKALSKGIGIHHGRIPRALAQYVVRQFNEGELPILVCTSTLIEGVNTSARNIVVFDNTISREQIDLFTFNNIKGRSGRMFRYFVGHVFVFHGDPQTELPFIDVPALSQSEDTPESLLVQMDDEDLTDRSVERRQRFLEQDFLSYQVIRENKGIDPDHQIEAAKRISSMKSSEQARLAWSGFPRYEQLLTVSELIFAVFDGRRLGGGSARTASQLAAMTLSLQRKPKIRELIAQQIKYSNNDPDEAVSRTLDFIRMWASFSFPRLLRAISKIQRDVLSRKKLPIGSYEWYASQLESLFLDPALLALEEYGLPLETARQLEQELAADGDIDRALRSLANLNPDKADITEFERELLMDCQRHL